MSVTKDAADHHSNATTHHDQAAHFHREASRHYQIGKDYAHAAHMALMARGHEVRAAEHGRSASAVYSTNETSPFPRHLTRSPDTLRSTAITAPVSFNGAGHHIAAAEHHEAAGKDHAQAWTYSSVDDNIQACHATQNALDHGNYARFHSDQAALRHMYSFENDVAVELI